MMQDALSGSRRKTRICLSILAAISIAALPACEGADQSAKRLAKLGASALDSEAALGRQLEGKSLKASGSRDARSGSGDEERSGGSKTSKSESGSSSHSGSKSAKSKSRTGSAKAAKAEGLGDDRLVPAGFDFSFTYFPTETSSPSLAPSESSRPSSAPTATLSPSSSSRPTSSPTTTSSPSDVPTATMGPSASSAPSNTPSFSSAPSSPTQRPSLEPSSLEGDELEQRLPSSGDAMGRVWSRGASFVLAFVPVLGWMILP